MKTPLASSLGPVLTGALLSAPAPSALACAVCFGQPDSPLAQGVTWGVWVLLGLVLGVLGGVASFFVFLARRSGRVPPQPAAAPAAAARPS